MAMDEIYRLSVRTSPVQAFAIQIAIVFASTACWRKLLLLIRMHTVPEQANTLTALHCSVALSIIELNPSSKGASTLLTAASMFSFLRNLRTLRNKAWNLDFELCSMAGGQGDALFCGGHRLKRSQHQLGRQFCEGWGLWRQQVFEHGC